MNTRSAVSQEEFNKPIYARTLSLRFYAIATSILGIISFFTIQGAKELFYYPSLLVVVGYITLAIPLICMPFFLTARRMPVVKVALWVMLLNYGANCLLTYGDIVAGGLVTDLFNGFLVVPIFETVLLVWTIQVLREVNVLLDRN